MDCWDRKSIFYKITCFILMLSFLVVLTPGDSRAAGYAYISNYGSGNVSKVPMAGRVINVGDKPVGVAVTPDSRYAYVANLDDDTVSRIVVATGVVDQTINVGDGPYSVAVTPDGLYVYVTNYMDSTVSRIVVASFFVDQTINVGTQPTVVAVTPNSRYAYVANLNDDTVSRIVTATGAVDQTINVGTQPTGVAVTPDGLYVYVTNSSDDTVSRIVTATGAVDQTINVGDGPTGVAVTPDSRYAYVANNGDSAVSRIVVAAGNVDQTINVGVGPRGVAVTPDGRYAYVANNSEGTVSRIVTATGAVDQTINVGDYPHGVAVTPDGRYLFVTNFDDDTVSMVDITEYFPPGNGPTPDPTPPGGPAHQLGGGGNNIDPPLPPGHTWQPGEDDTPHDLTMPLAYLGQGPQKASAPETMAIDIPGLMFQQTCPAGEVEEFWLPLGETGVMPNGVNYSTQMRWNCDLRVLDLKCVWPQEVIQKMAAGKHCLTYWLRTADGRKSNCRVEHMNCGPDMRALFSEEAGQGIAVNRDVQELLFKLQVSYFNKQAGFVKRIAEGMCEVETKEGNYGTYPIKDGMLTALIPFGVTSEIKFTAQVFNGTKTVRIEFHDGFMYAYDQDHRDAVVEVYQCVDGESYAIEYYQDLVYICNQGADPDGPILGRMFGK